MASNIQSTPKKLLGQHCITCSVLKDPSDRRKVSGQPIVQQFLKDSFQLDIVEATICRPCTDRIKTMVKKLNVFATHLENNVRFCPAKRLSSSPTKVTLTQKPIPMTPSKPPIAKKLHIGIASPDMRTPLNPNVPKNSPIPTTIPARYRPIASAPQSEPPAKSAVAFSLDPVPLSAPLPSLGSVVDPIPEQPISKKIVRNTPSTKTSGANYTPRKRLFESGKRI